MPLYQGEADALDYFESDVYDMAVRTRRTWDPAVGNHTLDQVCSTILFSFKDEGSHAEDYCQCHGYPGAILRGYRWTSKDDEYWLRYGRLRSRPALYRKHIEFARARNHQNQLIK